MVDSLTSRLRQTDGFFEKPNLAIWCNPWMYTTVED